MQAVAALKSFGQWAVVKCKPVLVASEFAARAKRARVEACDIADQHAIVAKLRDEATHHHLAGASDDEDGGWFRDGSHATDWHSVNLLNVEGEHLDQEDAGFFEVATVGAVELGDSNGGASVVAAATISAPTQIRSAEGVALPTLMATTAGFAISTTIQASPTTRFVCHPMTGVICPICHRPLGRPLFLKRRTPPRPPGPNVDVSL